jgi:quercetin dioxygenase-like cupin family protein
VSVSRGLPPEPHPWGTLRWLAGSGAGNAEGVTLGVVTIEVGSANPRHVHDNCEEVLYLLSGRLRHSLGADLVELGEGDVIVVPAGVAHHADNIGDVPAEMVVVYSTGTRQFRLAEE